MARHITPKPIRSTELTFVPDEGSSPTTVQSIVEELYNSKLSKSKSELVLNKTLVSPVINEVAPVPAQQILVSGGSNLPCKWEAPENKFRVGDILVSARTLDPPEWVPADETIYSQTQYPDLFNAIGLHPTTSSAKTWTSTSTTLLSSTNIRHIEYGNGVYVYCCIYGVMYASTDGVTWEAVDTTFGNTTINRVIYGNGTFVAIGDQGKIASSVDGYNWTARISGFGTSDIRSICYGNGKFVITGSGKVAYSTDGITWVLCTGISTSLNLIGCAYGNGVFIAATQGTTYLSSTNGITWSTQSSPARDTSCVTFCNGMFIAGFLNGRLSTSTNGTTWTTPAAALSSSTSVLSITYGLGLYVVTGSPAVLRTSPDLATWTSRSFGSSNVVNSMVFDSTANKFIGVQNGGRLIISTNGTTWSSQLPGSSVTGSFDIASGNGVTIAVGSAGKLVSSTDGITWHARRSRFINSRILTATYGNGTFVVCGESGKISSSTDGIEWTLRDAGFGSSQITQVKFLNGIFIAVGDLGNIATSPDGVVWTMRSTSTTLSIRCISYGNGKYIAGCTSGVMLISTDLDNWESYTNDNVGTNTINDIEFSKGLFVLGTSSSIWTSTDGIKWDRRLTMTGSVFRIKYCFGLFIAAGGFGFLSLSTDGLDWTRLTNTSTNSNVGVTSNEIAEFFLLNSVGSISRSSIGYNVLTDFVAPYIKTNSVRAYYRASM